MVFTFIFLIEVFVKLAGIGWSAYIKDGWTKFDLIVVFGGVIDQLVTWLNTSLFRVFRVGRVLSRVFRVLRVTRGLRLARSIEGTFALRGITERTHFPDRCCASVATLQVCGA